MRPYPVTKSATRLALGRVASGFTLPEVLTTVVIVGVLAAIASPSLLGWLNRTRVESAQNTIQGALQEAQRQAMRSGRNICAVQIPLMANPTLTSDCFVSGERRLENVSLSDGTAATTATVNFDFQGRTTSNLMLLISPTDNPGASQPRCLVVSNGLGLVRTGIFDTATNICAAQR